MVQVSTQKLFEILGSVYAEVRVLGEENALLRAQVAELTPKPEPKKAKK